MTQIRVVMPEMSGSAEADQDFSLFSLTRRPWPLVSDESDAASALLVAPQVWGD